jgi:hypothetical protein
MKKMTLTTLLLLSAVMVSPASANWFSRPDLGIQLNVGSAPNPTPNDLRALYANYPGTRYSQADVLRSMTGKVVYGENGEELGYILAVDERARLASLQLPTGIAVTIETEMLMNETHRVIAPTLSRDDVMAMAQAQTGRQYALVVTR